VKKIAHLTSVHPRDDVRVFLKECRTLAEHGFAVSLVVADGKGNEVKAGVSIVDVGKSVGGRLSRMTSTTRRILTRALELNADLYHLHDPELLPLAAKLKKSGKKVIFDSHEDFPADILGKPYLHPVVRQVVSRLFAVYEKRACKRLDFIVAATPTIRDKFKRLGFLSIDINNYPLVEELSEQVEWIGHRGAVCYIGAMTSLRGLPELVDAMAHVESGVQLLLAGKFSDDVTSTRCRQSPGWGRVNELGFVGREEVRSVMQSAYAGVVTFLSAPNHVDSQPNKMFEYMSAGIPVIASNFPLWRELIENGQCGICVDPSQPEEIAAAINYLHANQDEAQRMGHRGRKAVLERYNWSVEQPKLFSLYRDLLGA
jgi:glycosyltransferase involved in cell wall biosynthesis